MADSLHSGSISFGRYEKEPLDWERRSSFSHNRYLEEVEKCLKPGSVIEKKAYLEAHFKRKGGILSPGSSGSPSCRDYQTSETDPTENDVRRDAFDSIKEGAHRDHFHENDLENGNYREEYNYENEESQCEYASDNIHYVNYDESPEGSTYHVEYETTEHERENPRISYFESHTVLDNAVVVDRISEDVKIEETHQTQIKCDQLPVKNWDPAIEVNHNLNNSRFNTDESSQHIDLSPKSVTAAESDTTTSEHQSPKSRPATESKPTKPRFKPEVVNKFQNKTSRGAPKTAAKTQDRRERESLEKSKREKLSAQTATPTKLSLHRASKAGITDGSRGRSNHESKSEIELRAKNVVCSQTSTLKKGESRAYQEANRLKRSVNSTKPDARPGASPFNFKSSERAERRKEFYMKLEEKMHAKEAEMNQIQARTQEKKEAEIKQLRKSLNFKATPMPSFYHTSAPPGFDGNKAASSSTKSAKSQHKSMSPVSGAAARSPSFPKAENGHIVSAYQSVKAPNTTGHSTSSAISSPPSAKSHRSPERARNNGITGKKQPEKERDSSLLKHRVSVSTKVTKDQKVEGKLKVGTRRITNEMVRKSTKGIGIGNSSGISQVVVGVAS